MKAIKFRGWDIKHKAMVYNIQEAYDTLRWENSGVDLNIWFELDITMETSFSSILGNRNFPIMQYTSLKDKNGKEIYEGDILDDGASDEDGSWHTRCEVVYHERYARFGLNFYSPMGGEGYTGLVEHISQYVSNGYYVIGNIYENPELLK